jgi:hypothetical protein
MYHHLTVYTATPRVIIEASCENRIRAINATYVNFAAYIQEESKPCLEGRCGCGF